MWAVGLLIGLIIGAVLASGPKPEHNYAYARVERCGIDGIEREHAYVREMIWDGIGNPKKSGRVLCKIHLPKRDKEITLEVQNIQLAEQLKLARERIVYLESLYN